MLMNENLRNYFMTSYLHSVKIKAENDSLMPTQMRAWTTEQSHQCWRSHVKFEQVQAPKSPWTSSLQSLQPNSTTRNIPKFLSPLISESVNLQGNSFICWQKQTIPKGWTLEEAHRGASARSAIICRSHTPGTAFLILAFSKLFAQNHAFNAELFLLSIRPWTQMHGEENILEFLPYPLWEYQLPL